MQGVDPVCTRNLTSTLTNRLISAPTLGENAVMLLTEPVIFALQTQLADSLKLASPSPTTFPWWYGLGGVVVALVLGALIYNNERWDSNLLGTLGVIAGLSVVAAIVVITYSLSRESGVNEGMRWALATKTSAVTQAVATLPAVVAPNADAQDRNARNIVLAALGIGATIFLGLFIRHARRSTYLVSTQWGGFGGGSGGFQLAPSFLYLIVGVGLLSMLLMLTPRAAAPPGSAIVSDSAAAAQRAAAARAVSAKTAIDSAGASTKPRTDSVPSR